MKKNLALVIFMTCGFIAPITAQQNQKSIPKNWHLLDPATDSVQGVSAEKAYETLLKGKPSRKSYRSRY